MVLHHYISIDRPLLSTPINAFLSSLYIYIYMTWCVPAYWRRSLMCAALYGTRKNNGLILVVEQFSSPHDSHEHSGHLI